MSHISIVKYICVVLRADIATANKTRLDQLLTSSKIPRMYSTLVIGLEVTFQINSTIFIVALVMLLWCQEAKTDW